ncbi:MAG: hypothetical protein GEU99_19470 [Luteitalea sp.]|nr:hypothetical protein [Luteitalea sp.]
MRRSRKIGSFFRTFLRRSRLERELAEELQGALAELIARKMRSGLPPDEARRCALIELGGVEQVKEDVRHARIGYGVETTLRDIRYGWHGLWRSPGFTAAVMITIALGVGANTAVFSAVYGVLWRPLPFPESDRLIRLFQAKQRENQNPVSPLNYLDWRARATSLEHLAAYRHWSYELVGRDGKEMVPGARVSASLFHVLGVRPILGRPFGRRYAWAMSRVVCSARRTIST